MANPLKCDLCSKPATVHLTQIVNNKVHKVDLCEECAQAKGVIDPSGFSLADLLLKVSLNPEPAGVAGIRCEQCGFTPNDFKKQGRFGCPACYQTFTALVEPMLDSIFIVNCGGFSTVVTTKRKQAFALQSACGAGLS